MAAGLAVAFLAWGTLDSTGMGETTSSVLGELTSLFGWLFILVSAGFLLFSAHLAVTCYGNIKLGPDDSTPEYSTFSWVSTMFASGMGIGLLFWGVAEPLTYLTATTADSIPPGRGDPSTPDNARVAMEYAFFHWGFHPWWMYAVIVLVAGPGCPADHRRPRRRVQHRPVRLADRRRDRGADAVLRAVGGHGRGEGRAPGMS